VYFLITVLWTDVCFYFMSDILIFAFMDYAVIIHL